MVLRSRDRIRKSVTQGKGVSTPHAPGTSWYPLLFATSKGVFKLSMVKKRKKKCMKKKCRENKEVFTIMLG